MGWIVPTPAGTFRANWRDPAGKRSKTFATEKSAKQHLTRVESAKLDGSYVDDRSGKTLLKDHAVRWLAGRNVEARTSERTLSLLRTHVIPKWGDWPISRIKHIDVQEWVTELGKTLAPATVAKCHGLLSRTLRTAVRSRMVAVNAAD